MRESSIRNLMSRSLLALLSLTTVSSMNLVVKGAGSSVVNGIYTARAPSEIPVGFSSTCKKMRWNSQDTWEQLSNQVSPWWKHSENESYIYYNRGDRQWWIDGPCGAGLYVVLVPSASKTGNLAEATPPVAGWRLLGSAEEPAPSVEMIAAGAGDSL